MKSLLLVETVIGRLGLVAEGDYLTAVYFEHESRPPDLPVRETALLVEARAQLLAYFSGERTTFTLPLAPAGTAFQRRVWQALCTIPYGETLSYKEVVMGCNERRPVVDGRTIETCRSLSSSPGDGATGDGHAAD